MNARRPPIHEYTSARDEAAARIAEHERRDARTSLARLVVFALLAASAVSALASWTPWWPVAILGGAFSALVFLHERVHRALRRARLEHEYASAGAARVEERWEDVEVFDDGAHLAPEHHPFALDLDLFGPDSIFARVNQGRTVRGRAQLARWLTEADTPEAIRVRQECVAQLVGELELWRELWCAGAAHPKDARTQRLLQWCDRAHTRDRGPVRLWAVVATAVMTLGVGLLGTSLALGVAALAAGVAGQVVLRFRARGWRPEAADRERNLGVLRAWQDVLSVVERAEVAHEALSPLLDAVRAPGASASIARLRRLVEWRRWEANAIFLPIGWWLMWSFHVDASLDDWRVRDGHRVRAWLEAAGELEALCSLATHAFEHPEFCVPEILDVEQTRTPTYRAQALGHPLIAAAERVANDVSLTPDAPVWLVSGSNMSGKSTLLRSIGVGAAMAMAGGVVCAERLSMTPVSMGATMRVQDSLTRGASRFMAELERLKVICELPARGATLFLVDELLHGTNSKDRQTGALALIEHLLQAGAIGLVTTHDLAIADALVGDTSVRQVHFVDTLGEHGAMRFDYALKEGRVTRSNALQMLRAIGLDV